MADFAIYLKGFFRIGSKATVNANRRALLENMISYVPHTLTAAQKLQARKNIGIEGTLKVGKIVWLTKGIHDISFDDPFLAAYVVFPYGSTGSAGFVPIITKWDDLTKFTVKMPVDGYLSWQACLVTET